MSFRNLLNHTNAGPINGNITSPLFGLANQMAGGANGEGSNTASLLHNLARTMPPMMQVLKDVGGVELPETLARFSQEPHAAANGGPAVAATEPAPDGGRPAAPDHFR